MHMSGSNVTTLPYVNWYIQSQKMTRLIIGPRNPCYNPIYRIQIHKRKRKYLAESLSRLRTLSLYETNTPKKEGYEYSISVFDLETEVVCSVDSNQKVNQDFVIGGIKYQLNTEHEDDLLSPNITIKPNLQDAPNASYI